MCGRGRFAILAAHEVNEYAQQRPRARRGQRNHPETGESGDQYPSDAPSDPVCNTLSKYPITQNLSPGMECPVVFKSGDGADSKFKVENMVWGIIPTYLTNPSANDHYRMFNKRIESLERAEIAPYFKTVLQAKRCVVIMDGFYEWKMIAGKKHPHYVSLGENEPMKMAGIYEESNIFDPKIYAMRFTKSFSIITGDPCAKFAPMHNRMPLLLTDEQVLQWLEGPGEEVFSLLNQLKGNCTSATIPMNKSINFFPVTPKVTTASYQEEDCCTYKSIGQTLSSFFKTPYSPPAKTSSTENASNISSTSIKEEICASIGADISVAESKEDPPATPIQSELGKRSSGEAHTPLSPPQRSPTKRSLFTSTNLNSADDCNFTCLGSDAGSDHANAIDLASPSRPITTATIINANNATKSSSTAPKTSISTASTTKNGKSKSGTSTGGNKKAAASPGTRPITSFFARSPVKDTK